MPTILNSLPYFNRQTTLSVRGRDVVIKPTQIVTWVSIGESGQDGFNPAIPRFPAVLDTGLSHNFAISQEHLIRWAGVDSRWREKNREIRIGGDAIPLHLAELWLHPNRPGEREPFANRTPYR